MRSMVQKSAVLAFSLAAFATSPAMSQDRTEKVFEFDGWKVTIAPAGPRGEPATPPSLAAGKGPVIQPASAQFSDPSVVITPAVFSQAEPPEPAKDGVPPAPSAAAPRDPVLLAQQYREIYNAIPFLRSEYDANPAYRHDAAMEMLFGQMRPTVVHRGTVDVKLNTPAVRYVPSAYNRYGMNSFFYPFYWP